MGELVLRIRADDLSVRQLDGVVVLLDLRGSVYMTTNGTGALLLERLREGSTASELAALLSERYDIAVQQAEADVSAFLNDLRQRQLLVEAQD